MDKVLSPTTLLMTFTRSSSLLPKISCLIKLFILLSSWNLFLIEVSLGSNILQPQQRNSINNHNSNTTTTTTMTMTASTASNNNNNKQQQTALEANQESDQPYLTWQMSPTRISPTGIWRTWPPLMVANLCSCSILFWSPLNCFSFLQSLKAVTNTTTTTATRMATPSIQPASASVSSVAGCGLEWLSLMSVVNGNW